MIGTQGLFARGVGITGAGIQGLFARGFASNGVVPGTPGPHPLTVDFDSERKRVDFSMTSAEEA